MNTRFTLVRRPTGRPVATDFKLETIAHPPLGDGEFRIRNHYASLDPAIRGWLDDAPSYMPPIALGDPVRATTIGVIEASNTPDFAVGDWILGLNAIETHSLGTPGGFTARIDPAAVPSVTNYLSVFGAVGMTAYFGLLELGKPKPGDTVLVSGAAGAVGSLVGQIAKLQGCTVIGIAGSAEKCARLTAEYSFDHALNYREAAPGSLVDRIAALTPDGINVVFENVGGDCLDAALLNLAHGARVVLCGLIAEYNAPAPVGARNLWQLIVKSASIHGLLVRDYVPRFAEGGAQMAQWLAAGTLRCDEHIEQGIDKAYPAFMRLFEGSNTGKLILKLA